MFVNKDFFATKNNKVSLYIFLIFTAFAMLIDIFANDKPIIIKCNNKYYFPILKIYPETEFGGYLQTEADYKDKDVMNYISQNGWSVWPLIKFSYKTINYDIAEDFPSPPTKDNIFGTDDYGRDVFAQIFYGYRLSLAFGILVTFFALIIGVTIGLIQGYLGGIFDIIIQRIIEIWASMPFFFIVIAISYIMMPGFFSLVFILSITSWARIASITRFDVLKIRNMEYILFARSLGVGNFNIITRHILPNAMCSVLSYLPFLTAENMVKLAALDFIGFGLGYNMPSLGVVLQQSRNNMNAPWIAIPSFTLLSYVLIMLIFIGNDVRLFFRKQSR